jgi:hypothetical protein
MTVKLNLDKLDLPLAAPAGDSHAGAREPSLYGAITGQIAVGRYVLQIGDASGAAIREASRTERAHIRPRPTPVLLRPKLIRGLFDRRTELASALSALDAGLPIEVSGEAGIGKTAVLRHLAHHPRSASFVDGVIYLSARHQSCPDILQLVFEVFYESDEICKPTDAEIRRGLQDKQALILLDDVDLTQHELEQVLDIAPRSAFVVASRERCLWGEVRSLDLKGLPPDDAVLLLEREIERPLDAAERSAATSLCATLGGNPLRLLQAAAIARERQIPFDRFPRDITPESLVTDLLASVDEKQRRAMLALTALPGVPLPVPHISGIAEIGDLESSLMTLVRRGLVVSSQYRHRLADGVSDRLRRTEDLKPWVHRAITYFTAWAERNRRNAESLSKEAATLLRVQQSAADARRPGEVLQLGRLLEGALVVGVRWGAWGMALERCLAAAKATADRSLEGWALHEMGTRAACLGETGTARALLGQAVKLRESAGDNAAAAASRRNLGLVLAPVSNYSSDRDEDLDLDSLPLRDDAGQAVFVTKKKHSNTVAIAALLFVTAGGVGYWASSLDLPWRSWYESSVGPLLRGSPRATATSATGQPPRAAGSEPRVLQFSASPDRVAPGETVRLCYEVANGTRVRIDPDVGEVDGLRQNCVSAAPNETTTYMLTAQGPGGESVRQTVLVPVGIVATPTSGSDGPGTVPPRPEPEALAGTPAPAPPEPRAPPDRASILIFSPRPGSITTDRPTELCYAVSGALKARIEPDIGDVTPASTLTCRRVDPERTTTYELTAYGRDGQPVKQQIVIIAR